MKNTQDQLRDALRPTITLVTQAEAAKLAGIPRPQINQWLSGKRGMSLASIDRLAKALGISLVVDAKPVK